jgi:hypothetical protein
MVRSALTGRERASRGSRRPRWRHPTNETNFSTVERSRDDALTTGTDVWQTASSMRRLGPHGERLLAHALAFDAAMLSVAAERAARAVDILRLAVPAIR